MEESINALFDRALAVYSQDPFFETYLNGRKKYIDLTGKVDEDDEEFEAQMNCFNDWYLLDFQQPSLLKNYITEYPEFEWKKIDYSLNYSLFSFVKKNMWKKFVLKDYVNRTKIVLNNESLPLVQGDFFVGRTISINGETYLCRGICLLPDDVRSTLLKETKNVIRAKACAREYLSKVEYLKNKWLRFGRLEGKKIFVFNSREC